MAVFGYQATEATGTGSVLIDGTIAAGTPRQARDLLRAKGLQVVQLTEQQTTARASWWRRSGSPRSIRTIAFVRELSTLLGVGIPLVEAIGLLAAQHRGSFAAALLMLRDQVSAGMSLADAMRQQPQVFGELCCEITEVGESAGTLDSSLAQLAEFEERSSQFRNRLATALIYPVLVLVTGIGVSIFLMTFVVPNLLASLISTGRPLPLATKIVKAGSDLLVAKWWLLLLTGSCVATAMSVALSTRRGRRIWHALQLRLPLLGDLVRKQAVVRIATVMSTLLRSGIAFVRAVRIAQRSTKNTVLREGLERFANAVDAGQDIARALEATGAFPVVVVQVFSVGQQSGRLEEMLDRLAHDYDRHVATAAQRLTAVLEPLLILFLAVLVGLVAFATVLPILEASNVL